MVQPWNLRLKALQTVVFCQKDIMKFEESKVIKHDGDFFFRGTNFCSDIYDFLEHVVQFLFVSNQLRSLFIIWEE